MILKVSDLRKATVYAEHDRPVCLVSDDPKVRDMLAMLELVEIYPDTTDENGNWGRAVKIKVKFRGVNE